MRGKTVPIAVLLLLATPLMGATQGAGPGADPGTVELSSLPIGKAVFNADGSVDLPAGYREWSHVGTRFNPGGISILDGLPLKAPEVMNAYVEPGAMAKFQRTGVWPDGTQLVKEMSAIRTGAGCDDMTRVCTGHLGTGIFQAGYMGIGMMVKDRRRFPDNAGNWGYFEFGHRPPPYESISVVRPKTQCESCHVALAADTDYVISRAHIGLATAPDHK